MYYIRLIVANEGGFDIICLSDTPGITDKQLDRLRTNIKLEKIL